MFANTGRSNVPLYLVFFLKDKRSGRSRPLWRLDSRVGRMQSAQMISGSTAASFNHISSGFDGAICLSGIS